MTEAASHPDGYDPPKRITRLPSWLVAEVSRSAARLVAEALADEGARRPHFTVLAALEEQGAVSQAELGRRLAIDRSDMHALLGELEATGAVARVRDESDRRRNLVAITDGGRALLGRLGARVDAAQAELLAPLSPAERTELVRLLDALRHA